MSATNHGQPADAAPETLSPTKRAILEIRDLRARLDAAERRASEPIAIVGMGVRLPGGISTPAQFWTLLHEGRAAISEVPSDRWSLDAFYDENPATPGKMSTRFGGFLDRTDLFDARFFGITPREAVTMDPQQRLLLEVGWEALEDAGQAPDQLVGQAAGVFIGLSALDYLISEIKFTDPSDIDAYLGSGGSPSIASGRLSYFLGLQGPCITVDTACSSSLTALHLACQSLRLGECRLALAGGVNLILLPESTINFSQAGMMAPDGRCKTFDDGADGYVRSEGCGMLVLKRLSDALDNKDRILGVVRGSALNQDGKSSGLTVPNGPAQEALIRNALTRAGVRPADVSYVEAHGTGTSLGDPIELRALGRVFGEGRAAGDKLIVGSVKTNLGHLEAAAGVTGLIKVLLALQHREIPAHLNVRSLTSHVSWKELPIQVPTASVEWPAGPGRRIAGVSSFGFGGANAHVIIEEPPLPVKAAEAFERPLHLLVVSGKTDQALREAASRLESWLMQAEARFTDVCYTASAGRAHFPHRAAILAGSASDAGVGLAELSQGRSSARVVTGEVRAGETPDVAFLFDGSGIPVVGTARDLFDHEPVFRAAVERCDESVLAASGRSVAAALYPQDGIEGGAIDARDSAAALFTLDYALAELWLSWGVQPRLVAGAGVGAVAAACAAGAIALSDAVGIVLGRAGTGPVSIAEPRFAIVSHVTGHLASARELADPGYWRAPAAAGLRPALEAMHGRGVRLFVELGPGDQVIRDAREIVADPAALWLSSLHRDERGWDSLLSALAQLYVRGVAVRWADVDGQGVQQRVALPTYPFQRQRYWSDAVPPRGVETPTDAAAAPDAWFHEIVWRATPLAAAAEPLIAGTCWLLFADADGLGAALAAKLRATGARAVIVTGGAKYVRNADDFAIDLRNPEHTARLSHDLAGVAIDTVVHLASLDAPAAGGLSGSAMSDTVVATSVHLLHAVQAVATLTVGQPACRLWVVTRGAQPIRADRVDVVQAPVNAVAATIVSEHPDFRCVSIDLDPEPHAAAIERDAESLWRELAANDGREPRVAWRGDERFVARLIRSAAPPDAPVAIRPEATYLVTGGARGLGLLTAEWLAARGARSLVLVGRHGAAGPAADAVRAIEETGCNVVVAAGDVADASFVDALVARIAASMPPLAGVVHAAGVLDDGVLLQQSSGRFAAVIKPKVAGAWNLHRATRSAPLDFFVLFSSFAAVQGSAGQGNYAAANAFLDALAHRRRGDGMTGTSINWGAWAETGMAAATGRSHRRWVSQGLGAIDSRRGLEALGRLAATASSQVTVLPIDWVAFLAQYPDRDRPALLAELGHFVPSGRAQEIELPARWAALRAGERREAIEAHVREHIVSVLGLDANERLDPRQGLLDLGIDSLMTLELRNRLQRSIGRALPATVVFDYPSIAALAIFLETLVAAREGRQAAERLGASPAVEHPEIGEGLEPIAIVGIGCRLPGGVRSPDDFWTLLHDGVDAISEVPADRWDVDAYYDPDPNQAGAMITRWGGFVDGIDRFDPQFFGIAPREATGVDPQQRLLLEVSWEALEHAGQAPDRLHGSNTGVFVGISTNDYMQLQLRRSGPAGLDAHAATGGAVAVAAGRLSYTLGLQGPALAVDTACSSSLVAVHLACQSLRQRECELALAGGVNLILAPEGNVILSRARMLSPEGRCKTFDAGADGYVRSEGCGVVVLKRLSEAVKNGDRVLAVIRATSVNQDGRSGGLTVPNGPAQEALMRHALAAARVEPAAVDYIEAHGTGTALGDPLEARALANVFSAGRDEGHPLRIGSVKTNIGHLESAAGIAGLIKAALSLHHQEIPAHLHLRSLNPLISLSEIPAEIPTANVQWPAGPRRRIAGVSSFGFSGTNAHAVLEEAPISPVEAPTAQRPRHVLALSAKTPEALRALAGRYDEHLAQVDSSALADVCFTANVGRSHFEHRLAVTGASAQEIRETLVARAPSIGEDGSERPRIAFLFTGQGSQYAGMAEELYATQPVFAEALAHCDDLYREAAGESLLSELYPPEGQRTRIDETAITQPALFAVEYALSELWRSWGIVPDAVIGHSVGELVAACVAGMMSLDDAFGLTVTRARLMQSLPAGGAMAAIAASEASVRLALASLGGGVSVAAVNGPDAVVISGEARAVEAVCRHMETLGIASRPLTVSHAFHSALMEPILDALEGAAAHARISEPKIAIASNVTGRILAPSERCTPQYWRDHARGTVRFADGVRALAESGCTVFIEIGPAATLTALGRRAVEAPAQWIASLRKGRGDWEQIASAVAQVYESGAGVDWTGFDRPYPRRRVTLPTYAFQRERYWIEDRAESGPAAAAASRARVRSPLAEIRRRCAEELTARVTTAGSLGREPGTTSSPAMLERGWRGPAEALGEITVGNGGSPYAVQASLFECCAALARAGLPDGLVRVPMGEAHHVAFSGTPGSRVWAHVSYGPADASANVHADVELIGDDEAVIATMEGLRFTGPGNDAGETPNEKWIDADAYEVEWRQSPSRADSRGATEWLGDAATGRAASADPPPPPRLLVQESVAGAAVPRSIGASQPLGIWLVLVDCGGLGEAIGDRLSGHGAECIVARAGDETRRGADGRWTVDPSAPEAFDGVIDGASGPLRGVVHCFSLDATPLEDATPALLERAGVLACGTLLHLTQALLRAGIEPRVWVVTRDAVAALPADAPRGVTQAPAWGFGRVLSLEHPELWGGLIDVTIDEHTATAARVVEQILAPDVEDQIALRREGRLVPRLVPVRAVAPAVTSLSRDASYLVTGGTGGIGLLVAREMARQGAGHLILLSRNGIPGPEHWAGLAPDSEAARQVAAVREIEALGTRVTAWVGDVESPDHMRLLSQALGSMPPLRGVVHAAAHMAHGRVRDLSLADVARMLGPKVNGTWLLDGAIAGAELDFFVLFSSTAGVFGAGNLAHYAAANVFLDGFARARRGAGRPAVSIAWGPWERIRGTAEEHMTIDRGGMKIMPAARTLAAFSRLRTAGPANCVFAEIDWPTLKSLYESKRTRPFFDQVGRRTTVPTAPTGDRADGLVERLQRARPPERRAMLLAHVRQLAAQVLGLRIGQVDPRRGLFDLGMDSLMSVDLKARLENTLGRPVPSTVTFNYPTVGALTDYVATELLGLEIAPAAAASAIADPSASDTDDDDDDLSEDELAALLAAQLEKAPR